MFLRMVVIALIPMFSFVGCLKSIFGHCTIGIGYGKDGTTGTANCNGAGASPQDIAALYATRTDEASDGSASPAMMAGIHDLVTSPERPPIVLFRITDILVRDPHTYQNVDGICVDRTGIINSAMHDRFNSDQDHDGAVDAGGVLAFQGSLGGGNGGSFQIVSALCDPLFHGHCLPDTLRPEINAGYSYTNDSSNPCFAPFAGTLRPYVPALAAPAQPCFVTSPFDLTVSFGGTQFTLLSTLLAGTFAGSGPDSIVNGVMRAFLPESLASSVILPSGVPDVGGQPLSATFPGGAGACASGDDRDTGPDGVTRGWWIYANYSARRVSFPPEVLEAAGLDTGRQIKLAAWPNPFKPSVRISFELRNVERGTLLILDPTGRRVRGLMAGESSVGRHELVWNGEDDAGRRSPPGVYYAVLSTTSGQSVSRLVRLN